MCASRLIEIFLQEGDEEAAWREAREGGCSDPLWLTLAGGASDAAPIYLKLAESSVDATRNERYGDVVALLVRGAAVMKKMGRGEEFVTELESLREVQGETQISQTD